MKNNFLSCLFVLACVQTFGQTISISGTVKDQQGQVVPVAFVRDAQHYYATYADSTGAFTLKADPSSTLTVIADGYNNASVKINNNAHVDVVLIKGNTTSGSSNSRSEGSSSESNAGFLHNGQQMAAQNILSQNVKAGFNQESTRGSMYLFDNWVHGFAISTGDSLLYDINNLYNYDKLTGNLLYTADKNTIMQVNNKGIKYFSLFDGKPRPHIFENAPAIGAKPFSEVMISTTKYKIYKQIDTRLVRADFHTDGVVESGHRYDEYQDVTRYYFLKLPDGKPKQFSLKKKALKELLAGDGDKFIDSQGSREIDDDYLRDLGYSLTQ